MKQTRFNVSSTFVVIILICLAFPLGVWAASAYTDSFDSDPTGGADVTSFTTGTAERGLSYVCSNCDSSYATDKIYSIAINPGEAASITITARDGSPFEFVSIYVDTNYDITIKGNGSAPFTINVGSGSIGTYSPDGGNKKVDEVVIANVSPSYTDFDIFIDNVSVVLGVEGQTICGISSGNTYTFVTQSDVAIQVTSTGTNLGCLKVLETDSDHPNATGTSGVSGTKTGKYWTISALQSNGTSAAAEDFTLNLTLPHSVSPDTDAKVCKYTGGAGYGWDCARTSSTSTTVTRNGISSLSDWAVGDNVGPTAVTQGGFTAHPVALSWVIPFGLVSIGLCGLALRRRMSL